MQSIIFLLISNAQSFPTTSFPITSFPTTSVQIEPSTSLRLTSTLETVTKIPTTVTTTTLQRELLVKKRELLVTFQRELLVRKPLRNGFMIYNDNENVDQSNKEDYQRKTCKIDEYEIHIFMSDDPWSGTDDDVFIRLYSTEEESTEWFMLDTPGLLNNDFERLSYEMYCLPSNVHYGVQPIQIGILKTGTDDMKINGVIIWDGQNCFDVDIENDEDFTGKWIKNKEENNFNVGFC